MATAFASSSSSPQISTFLSSTFHSKSYSYMSLRTITLLSPRAPFSPIIIPSKKSFLFHHPPQRNNRVAPILAAAAEYALPLEAAAVDATNQVVTNSDDGVSIVISALLFVAFIGLSIITIGVKP
ncbi:hypothetical protein SESBI_24733 [Sesbania bispinosa]|nr:hypothetical protein SESBI_24733 [Sesbania bispinosa]